MFIEQFFVEGLGCASYLLGCESQGVAAVVDPQRDVRPYLQSAKARGLKITHIIETHLHADHVSGNTELAARTGAQIYLHEAAQATFSHLPLKDGDFLQLGGVRIAILHTPGHTPESITLLVSDTTRSPEAWMALTGDLLFVGDVGRPDLVGLEAARNLAGDLHDSLFGKLLKLDGSLLVYPGHGAGSLCGRSIGSVRASTLGYEQRTNPALSPRQRDEFITYMTNNLPEQPGNHLIIKALNRRGPRPLGEIQHKALSLQEAIPHFQSGAALLDVRSKDEYVQLHVPGSVHMPADDQISNRIGFILSPDQPVILLLGDESPSQVYEHVVYSLARVGYDKVIGAFAGGISAWQAAGLSTASGDIQDVTPAELHAMLSNGSHPVVLDVREPWEYAQGHIPGALLIPLGQLSSRLGELDPAQPVAAVCASGNRSQSASMLLGQRGFQKVYNLLYGMSGWQHSGYEISRNGHSRTENATSFTAAS